MIRSTRAWAVVLVLALVSLVWFIASSLPRGAVAYSLRPLWDRNEAPAIEIPHYATTTTMNDDMCRLHGWDPTRPERRRAVWDCVLFSTELDLLLIRLDELDAVVDRFFVLDSNATFTGNPKPALVDDALKRDPRFARFANKITHATFTGHALERGRDPFDQENEMRMSMTDMLKRQLALEPPEQLAPVMLFSDVDEIPSRRTVQLLTACEFESPLHLGMRSYIYSFEWQLGREAESWRPQAWKWSKLGNGPEEYYRHGKVTDRVLVDSGWHCSWCFRTIEEFVTKARGYSHVDRLGSRPAALLRPERIQDTICRGLDMFKMLPEAYTYRDFVMKLKLVPSKSAVNLPNYVIDHARELKYLLPGGCVREPSSSPSRA